MYNRYRIGKCKVCGKTVLCYQIANESLASVSNIQIDWVTADAGFWVACENPNCTHHYGEGTLSNRPVDMFPAKAVENLGAKLDDLSSRINAAKRGEWPKPAPATNGSWGNDLPGG